MEAGKTGEKRMTNLLGTLKKINVPMFKVRIESAKADFALLWQ